MRICFFRTALTKMHPMPASPTPPTPGDPFSFKVLTVNIHKGFSPLNRNFMLHDLRDAVRKVSADVVFLQEVQGAHLKHANRVAHFPQTPQYEFLADSIWQQFAYGRNAVYDHGHHGNALLSKFPIAHFENHNISIAGPERRGMLHCVLKVPGRSMPIHTICIHLSLAENHRRQQLALMCKMIHRDIPADAPLIIAGDFNDWRNRAHDFLAHEAGLKEVFVQATGRAAKTFPARLPILQLDRIYVRNAAVHAPMILPGRPWSHLSDHAPLAAHIDL